MWYGHIFAIQKVNILVGEIAGVWGCIGFTRCE
jgi:hypothetical protein